MCSHPPSDLLLIDFLIPDLELQIRAVRLYYAPMLGFSNDRFHFLGLDILVELPLADSGPVLSKPGGCQRGFRLIYKS